MAKQSSFNGVKPVAITVQVPGSGKGLFDTLFLKAPAELFQQLHWHFGLYQVTVDMPEGLWLTQVKATLPVPVTVLLKKQATPALTKQAQSILAVLLLILKSDVGLNQEDNGSVPKFSMLFSSMPSHLQAAFEIAKALGSPVAAPKIAANVSPKPLGKPKPSFWKPTPAPAAPAAPAAMPALPKVKLVDATAVMQPVAGTDPHSIYYVIAIGKRVKLAARVKGNGVSVRAEGAMSTNDRTILSKVGMAGHEHMSMHLPGASTEAPKIIGSLIFDLQAKGFEFVANLRPDQTAQVKGL